MLPTTLNSFKSEEFTSLIEKYNKEKAEIALFSERAKESDSVIHHFMRGNKITSSYPSSIFDPEGATKSLNASYWSKVMNILRLLPMMPAKARNEWSEMIHDMKTPDFTEETIRSTVMDLISRSGDFFIDKVEGVFTHVSKEHVTNSPNAFREKLIIANLLDKYGFVNHYYAEHFQDLRSIIGLLHGEEEKRGWGSDLIYELKSSHIGEWVSIDCDRLKVKLFKGGTLHIQIEEEVAVKLNRILAQRYPSVIADVNSKNTRKNKKRSNAQDRSEYISESVAITIRTITNNLKRDGSFFKSHSMDKKGIKEFKSVMSLIGLNDLKIDDEYVRGSIPKHLLKALSRIGLSRVIPDYKGNQFYPTKEEIKDFMQIELDAQDSDKILEPSAGQGNLVDNIDNKSRITTVEINELNSLILEEKGYVNHFNGDFLNMEMTGVFDKIIMNPPFSEGRANAHLMKAIESLNHGKKGNRIVACLPASFKGKIFSENLEHSYSDVFKDQFDNTGVAVVVLTLKVI